MWSYVRRRATYANVVATIALFVALGGSAYATSRIGSRDIVDGSVRSKDIRNNEIRSADVRDGSLLPTDFKAGQLPQGATGDPGPKGDRGPTGPAGATNVTTRQAAITPGVAGGFYNGQADCEPGEKATGGGYFLNAVDAVAYIATPQPNSGETPTGWYVGVSGPAGMTQIGVVLVICAA